MELGIDDLDLMKKYKFYFPYYNNYDFALKQYAKW